MTNQSILITLTESEFDAKLDCAVSKALERALAGLTRPTPELRFYSRKEAARKLNVPLPTLHQWTLEGKVVGHRVGSRVLYKEDELNSALQKIQTKIRATA